MPLCDETTARRIDDERRWNEDFLHDDKVLYDTANIEMTPTPQTNENDCGKFLCVTHATPHQKL